MSSISISSTFSACSKRGRRGGGGGFASILIVMLLTLLSSWREQELKNVVSALQIVQRLSPQSFFHNQSSTAATAASPSLSPSPSPSNLWVSSSQEDEDNRSIENLLSIPSLSSFDNGYSSSSGFNNLEKELFDPVQITRLCDDDRSHSQRSMRIIQ